MSTDMGTDDALSALRGALAAIEGAEANGEGSSEATADALVAAAELDRLLSAGESLPKAWATRQRIEIVHARPRDWSCQLAVFVGGNELMTEDRSYSYVDVDPNTPPRVGTDDWWAEADAAIDPMHGYSPAFVDMIRQAYKQNTPK
jgi:hypothetical protein